jgi:hypothetical protein
MELAKQITHDFKGLPLALDMAAVSSEIRGVGNRCLTAA